MRRFAGLMLLIGCAANEPVPDDGVRDDTGPVPCEMGLSPGDCAPDFTLVNADGESVTLSELQGRRLVVLGSSLW